jgi:hypothetical protein
MQINYVSKETLYPKFGFCSSDGQTIQIREDLPGIVGDFVLMHEMYHSTDKSTNWLWREIKANCYAFIKNPIGGIITVFMSLSPYRLKYYFMRFKNGQ